MVKNKRISPLGTKLYFHVNSSTKNSIILTPNIATLSRDCKPRIRIHSSTQDSSGNIGNRACVEVAILNTVLTVKSYRLDLVTSPDKKYPDLAATLFRIHSVFQNFHSGERIQKVADSYAGFTGYVWTEALSGKESCAFRNIRIRIDRAL